MMRFQTTDQPVNIENTGRVTEKQRDGKTLEEGDTNLFHWGSAHSWMRTPGSWRKWQRWRVDSVIGSVNAQAQSWPHCSPSPLLPPEQTQDWHSLLLHTTSYARIFFFQIIIKMHTFQCWIGKFSQWHFWPLPLQKANCNRAALSSLTVFYWHSLVSQ